TLAFRRPLPVRRGGQRLGLDLGLWLSIAGAGAGSGPSHRRGRSVFGTFRRAFSRLPNPPPSRRWAFSSKSSITTAISGRSSGITTRRTTTSTTPDRVGAAGTRGEGLRSPRQGPAAPPPVWDPSIPGLQRRHPGDGAER